MNLYLPLSRCGVTVGLDDGRAGELARGLGAAVAADEELGALREVLA